MNSDYESVVIVTGAASNIGLAIAKKLSAQFKVVIADVADATDIARSFQRAVSFKCDVTDPAQCAQLVDFAAQQGVLTTVVHSAAITAPATMIVDIPQNQWRRIIDVNLNGTFNLMQACIPSLLSNAKQLRNHGTNLISPSVVLITSRAAKTGFAALSNEGGATKAHYCASKAAVISLTKSLALELAQDGIRVNSVAPGPIEGEMIPKDKWDEIASRVPLKRMGKPEDIAEAVNFLVSPAANFITGHILDVNGGTLMD